MLTVMLVLRIVHILGVAGLVGSIFFNYIILRPSLAAVPPAYAVVIAQRTGTLFTYLGWTTLAMLVGSGALRLWQMGQLEGLFTLSFYETGRGRAIGLMVLGWLVTTIGSGIMSFVLRPVFMSKLGIDSDPDLAAVERRRNAQLAASQWLGRLQVMTLVASVVAAVAGASAQYGGLF